MASQRPKWATSSRQAQLVNLWIAFGNKCLHGHALCPIPEHYVYLQPHGAKVPIPKLKACVDGHGNPIVDESGNQLFITVYGEKLVTIYEAKLDTLYDLLSEEMIKDWVNEDKAEALAQWKAERRAIHNLGERRYPLRGQFSSIAKDIFFENQPLYYLLGLGVSGLTYRPFARVRLSSSYEVLHVDLGNVMRGVTKCKKRKAIRYGKGLPITTQLQINKLVALAVKASLH